MQKSTSTPLTSSSRRLWPIVGTVVVLVAFSYFMWKRSPQKVTNTRTDESAASSLNGTIPSAEIGDAITGITAQDPNGKEISLGQESDRGLIIVAPVTSACTSCSDVVTTIATVVGQEQWHIPAYAIVRGEVSTDVRTKLMTALHDTVLDDGPGDPMSIQFPDSSMPTVYFVKDHAIVGVGYGSLTVEQIKEKITLLR